MKFKNSTKKKGQTAAGLLTFILKDNERINIYKYINTINLILMEYLFSLGDVRPCKYSLNLFSTLLEDAPCRDY